MLAAHWTLRGVFVPPPPPPLPPPPATALGSNALADLSVGRDAGAGARDRAASSGELDEDEMTAAGAVPPPLLPVETAPAPGVRAGVGEDRDIGY